MSTHTTVRRDPKLLKGQRRRTMEGRWVAAQKPPQQHLAGETSLLGTTRSSIAVARAPTTSRGQPPFEVNGSPRSLEHQVVGERDSVKEETGSAKSCLQYCACDWPLLMACVGCRPGRQRLQPALNGRHARTNQERSDCVQMPLPQRNCLLAIALKLRRQTTRALLDRSAQKQYGLPRSRSA